MEATKIFNKGDKVSFTTRDGKILKGTFIHTAPNGKAYIHGEDGKAYEREHSKILKISAATTAFDTTGIGAVTLTTPAVSTPTWDINKKFDFLAHLTRMVINGTSVSLIITGEGGLGKSYTVKRQLELKKLAKLYDYVIIKGFSTPRGLYRTLFENNGKLVIFDDCDEVMDDKIAANLLKGALDSYDTREISWITKSSDESLPDSFEFTGRVIFISNKSKEAVPQALLSRSMNIDVTMSAEDKVKRMQFIIDNSKEFMSEYPKSYKQESLDMIREHMYEVRELSLRSLEKVLKIRAGERDVEVDTDVETPTEPVTWQELAKFMLLS